jgi:multicomponent Na+:H+ antiporter subunit B
MISLILSSAARFLLPLMVLFSFFLLLRGHNEPGGGFVGGLVVSSAYALYALAFGVADAKRILRIDPMVFIGLGLLVAVSSGLVSLALGIPFMTGVWAEFDVPVFGKVGTPLVFDFGVYFVVLGITLTIIFSLMEE